MSFVGLVPDCLHEVTIAPDATTIFWRASSLTFQAKGVLRLWIGLYDPLEKNLMIPGIAKVVLVLKAKPLAFRRQDVTDRGGRGVFVFHRQGRASL